MLLTSENKMSAARGKADTMKSEIKRKIKVCDEGQSNIWKVVVEVETRSKTKPRCASARKDKINILAAPETEVSVSARRVALFEERGFDDVSVVKGKEIREIKQGNV